jgi:hypothetical protein
MLQGLTDKRFLRLIRGYLQAGVMVKGRPVDVMEECADIANFALMIADNRRGPYQPSMKNNGGPAKQHHAGMGLQRRRRSSVHGLRI